MMNVIKVDKAVEILKAHGYKTANVNKIKAGIEQGLFPFGVAVHLDHTVYDIFEPLLMDWIKERS